MGRSVAQFQLPTVAATSVLQAALSYASETGMVVDGTYPDHVDLHIGSGWWTGRKRFMIAARDSAPGALVEVHAWVEAFMLADVNANPDDLVGMIPRRHAWRLVTEFVRRLGVPHPEFLFRHL